MVRLGLILALLAVVAAGCDSGSDSAERQPSATTQAATTAPEQPPAATQQATTESAQQQSAPRSTTPVTLYTKADLPRLALQPADAPDDMHYTREESGPKTLFDVGVILDDQVAEVRGYGFRGVYDVIYDSTTSDIRLASRLWLFREADGARRWLEKTRGDSTLFEFQRVPAPRLADGSWAARGSANGSDVISHAFRAGNVVVVVSYSTQSVTLSEADVLATAKKAVARVLRR